MLVLLWCACDILAGAVSFPGPTASPVWSKVSGVTATTLSFVAIFYSAYNIYHVRRHNALHVFPALSCALPSLTVQALVVCLCVPICHSV